MSIDTAAGTVLTRSTGDPKETDFLRYDLTNLGHYAKPDADVLVVGVGGGRDILSALEFDQKSVTGVELNGDILRMTNGKYGDFTGHLDRNPKVQLRQRRGAQLPHPHRQEVRHHPDLAHRHLGGDARPARTR